SGTYSVTVTGANGCTDSASVVITGGITPPTAGITNNSLTTTLSCATQTISLTATGGVSYEWEDSSANPNRTITTVGVYTVTVTDALGCTASASINITGDPTLGTNFGSVSGTVSGLCEGESINITASGGITYQWSGPGGYTSSGANLLRPNATPAMSGIYTVTITAADGCIANVTISVAVHPLPPASIMGDNAICSGENIVLTATGGISYSWSGPGGYTNTSNVVNRGNATAAMAGTYTVTVTNANSCTASASMMVTVNTAPVVNIIGSTNACLGGTISLTATGGGTYAWTGPGGYTATGATITRTNATLGMTGTYVVVVTDINGCTSLSAVTVTVNTATAGISGATGFCSGSTITLTATGGGTYAWNGPGGFTASGATLTRGGATLAMSGVYTVTVTAINGCTATASHTITIGSPITASISGSTGYCEGATIALTATGGATYNWSGPGGFSSSGAGLSIPNAGAANAGTYTVTVTSSGGCSATASRTITINPLPIAGITGTSEVCVGSTITLTASGGSSYAWTGPGFSATTATINRPNSSVTMSGTYTVTITSSAGCVATASFNVMVNARPTVTITGENSVCSGSDISLTASGGVTYNWSGPGGFTSTDATMVRSLATTGMTGTYAVTVTNAAGCTQTASRYVTVKASPTANITGSSSLCAGANIGLTASGGTSYSWSGPGGFTASTTSISRTNATVAMSGVYTVTVTASNGCTASASRTVTVNALPIATASSNSPVCTGTAITLFASGGSTYAWQGPNLFSSSVQNPVRNSATLSMGGTYTVTVTDVNGCKGTANTVVSVITCPGKVGEETQTSGLMVYPNPSGGMVTVWFTANSAEMVKLAVYSSDGKEVAVLFMDYTEPATTYQLPFDATYLPSGTYFALLQYSSGKVEKMPVMIVR
ncbi:MAG TPA: T9SS type A sorting domain-containing protein, partial [Chitinophagales bacterium]|nr:T9SS type A sorting domain-containing protein [Chitinophagales bacterium]